MRTFLIVVTVAALVFRWWPLFALAFLALALELVNILEDKS